MPHFHKIISRVGKLLPLLAAIVIVSTLTGCRGAKLSVANEQFERGEYFEAQKTYRKIYNKLTKREERRGGKREWGGVGLILR